MALSHVPSHPPRPLLRTGLANRKYDSLSGSKFSKGLRPSKTQTSKSRSIIPFPYNPLDQRPNSDEEEGNVETKAMGSSVENRTQRRRECMGQNCLFPASLKTGIKTPAEPLKRQLRFHTVGCETWLHKTSESNSEPQRLRDNSLISSPCFHICF